MLNLANRLLTNKPNCFHPEVMRKPKTKSQRARKKRAASKNVEKRVPYQKAAVRSRAFAKAILEAKSCATDPERLRALFDKAAAKGASIRKEPFKDTWAYFQAMLRLIRAYSRGEYRAVSQRSLLSIIAALNYLVDPFDLIPDEIPFLGFLDDATVMTFAVRKTKEDLDDFMTWETCAV
jgi:uncharacterized membrane protein YkvA (DUF1232 family)